MKFIYTLIILLISISISLADSPKVTLVPPVDKNKWIELKAEKGRLTTLEAAPASTFEIIDDSIVEYKTFESGKYCTLVFPIEGRYKILVSNPSGGITKLVIVIGDVEPIPPVPPTPPIDALKKLLQTAFNTDTGTNKIEDAKDLASLYTKLAELVQDKTYVKASDFLAKAHETSDNLIGTDSLVNIRNVVKGELNKILPVDITLTQANRDTISTLFNKLAKSLTEIAEGK